MRKSIEKDRFLDEFFELCDIGIDCVSRELASGRLCEFYGIEWGSGVSFGRGPGFRARRSGRWSLTRREGIILIVEHEVGDVIVAPAGMEEVPETDPIAIPVSSDADHVGLRIRELDPDGERYRPSVQGFCRIAVDVLGNLPRASDSAHDNNVLLRDFEFLQGFPDSSEDEEIPAPGAPLD